MRAGRGQFDVPHTLAANLGEGHLNAAFVADHAAMLHALVLAAQTLPVRNRTKNARAKQAITLRLEGAVIDSLRLGHFTVRPGPDLFRRCQADADGGKLTDQAYTIIRAAAKQGFLLQRREKRVFRNFGPGPPRLEGLGAGPGPLLAYSAPTGASCSFSLGFLINSTSRQRL